MNKLLSGVAIVAVLAISAPSWAQMGPKVSGGGSAKPTAAAPAAAPAKPAMMAPAAKRPMHQMRHHRRMAMHSDDTMTEQLNQAELARIQGGGGMAAPAGDRMPGVKAGPK